MRVLLITVSALLLNACATTGDHWHLALRHDRDGSVMQGSHATLIDGIRNGCALRVAWGVRRSSDPTRTIEHVATPVWVSLRDGQRVEVQLDEFMINLNVLGEPAHEHANRVPYGGTDRAVHWRASLTTNGEFNAVWFDRQSGELIRRVPQRHAMSWFVQCAPQPAVPLFLN